MFNDYYKKHKLSFFQIFVLYAGSRDLRLDWI